MGTICFITFCYIFFAYGISLIVTQNVGPFNIFFRLRLWTENINSNLGLLFRCMTCFPTNVGMVFSLLSWFLLPIQLTPFTIILHGTNLWWVAALMDACLTGGIVHLIWNVDDYIDKNTPIFEDDVDDDQQG